MGPLAVWTVDICAFGDWKPHSVPDPATASASDATEKQVPGAAGAASFLLSGLGPDAPRGIMA
ncbi:hypothetical protein [Luteimonas sp. 100069]|uniref:hypothetical protein n=1 Tax=Luteimonas sp. 100069 TaxID=2006109 RepID=UPI0018F7019B|nr:hypothetical protein [Luteimonas sp. 100069]